jgi:hypothetical protein
MREHTTGTTDDAAGRYSGTRTALASIGAVGSVLAASSCCLPILPLFLAAVFAGSSAFLAAATPYLLGASILFICYGVLSSPASEKMSSPCMLPTAGDSTSTRVS